MGKQKRKNILVIFLCGVLALALAVVCIVDERSREIKNKSLPIIEVLDGTSWNWYGEYGHNWVFHEYYLTEEDILDEEYKNRDWEVLSVQDGVMNISVDGYRVIFEIFYTEENGIYTIDILRNQHYGSSEYEYAERLKDHSVLLEELDAMRTEAFAGNDPMKMIEYIEWVKTNSEDLEIPIIECFPYREMKTYIETYGTKVILENGVGGYYDNIQDQYENEEYWYSPLFEEKYSKGSVGTYRYTERYEFYGDLMSRYIERYWYDTAYSDPNNSNGTSWYYKGKDIGNSDEIGIGMLIWSIREVGDIECLYSIESGDEIMLCAIEGANIHIIQNNEMVTIAYE